MKSAKANRSITTNFGTYDILLLLLLSTIILITPFFRGLYFRENYIPTIAIVAVLFGFVIFRVYKSKNLYLISNFIDIGMVGLVLAYMISFFNAVSPMDALDSILKIIGVYFVYLTSKYLCTFKNFRKYFYDMIVFYGFIISLSSMLSASGIVKTNVVLDITHRLIGLYQYSNATASVFAAIYMYIIIKLSSEEEKFRLYLYGISASTIMLAFLQTKSRGGIVMLGAAWLISLLLVNNKGKLKMILFSITTSTPAILLFNQIYTSFVEKKGFLFSYFILLAVTVALTAFIRILDKYISKISSRLISYTLITIAIISIISAWMVFQLTEPLTLSNELTGKTYELYDVKPETDYLLNISGITSSNNSNLTIVVHSVDKAIKRTKLAEQHFDGLINTKGQLQFTTLPETQYAIVELLLDNLEGAVTVEKISLNNVNSGSELRNIKLKYKFIPDDVAEKLTEINLKTESYSERITFIKDGMKIFKDYPVFGAGGGAWNNLYTKYQSYPYKTREAHNYYFQTTLESGIVGIIFIAIVLYGIVRILVKSYKNKSHDRNLLVALFALVLVLLGHAAIDFDFSFYAIMIFVWFSIGVISSFNSDENLYNISSKYKHIVIAILCFTMLFTLVLSSFIYNGLSNGRKGALLIDVDPKEAKIFYQKAVKQDFFNVLYKVDYLQILNLEAKQIGDSESIQYIYQQYNEMRKVDPYKVTMYQPMLSFYLENGYISEANEVLDTLIELQPLNSSHYEIKAEINQHILNLYLEQGNVEQAIKHGNIIIQVIETHKTVNSKIISPFELTDKTKAILNETEIRLKNMTQNK